MAKIGQKRRVRYPPYFIYTMDIKQKTKIKYLIQVFVLTFVFALFAIPALASEINSGNVIKLVNESRRAQGLSELVENEKLDKIAQDKANDMVRNNYFAHTSPVGINPWYWFEKESYDYRYAGENLAINFLSVETQHKAWMDSATHRKNILNPKYQEIGVAIAAGEINGQTSIIAVQEFGSRAGAPETLNNKENFSGKEKTNLIQDEKTKLGPAVLSVKDLGNEKLDFNNLSKFGQGNGGNSAGEYLKNILTQWNNNKAAVYSYAFDLALIILMLAIALAPAIFMKIAYDEIFSLIDERRKFRALSTISLKEYEEMLKNMGRSGMVGDARVIKVRPG